MTRIDRLAPLALVLLATLALLAALDAAEGVLSPILFALVTGIVLSPLSDLWERWGFPPVVGALSSLVLTLTVVGLLVTLLQPIAARLVAQVPKVLADMRDTMESFSVMLRGLKDAADVVADTMAAEGSAPPPATEATALPTMADAIMLAPAIVGQVMIFSGVLFFFLLTRHDIYATAAHSLSGHVDDIQIVARLRRAERHVARYFLTVSLVNAGLGAATAAALSAIGLPDAILWGVLCGLVNFVPYLGPAIIATALVIAGVAAFDGALSLAPALSFVALNFIEGQFVTPAFVGHQMRVNPLAVFIALVFGMWLWGAIGGIIALPLVIWIKILRDERRLNLSALPENAKVLHDDADQSTAQAE
jgi:predicted PurR-regulated permease PerM